MAQRIAGTLVFRQNGVQYRAKGSFEYNLGLPKNEPIIGQDGVHGFKAVPQPAYIAGEITDDGNINVKQLVTGEGLTVTLELLSGKAVVLTEAVFTEEGTVTTEEGTIAVRFDSGVEGQEF